MTDIAQRDVPTCRLGETVGALRKRMPSMPGDGDLCVVVNGQMVVLGVVEAAALGGDPTALVDQIMQAAPPTLRPDLDAEQMPAYLHEKQLAWALVTTSDGVLLGLLRFAN